MENTTKKISVLVPTYNEEDNVAPLSKAIINQFETNLKNYDYEIVFIDNYSTDKTRKMLEYLCEENNKIKAIFNAANFGQFNSPFYGMQQTTGDCTISMCADFQDPVEFLPELVKEWENGYKIVCAVKKTSKENGFMRFLRTCYYKLIKKMSDVNQIEHFTGFGLYDKSFIDVLKKLDDPTPFLRGIVAEIGFKRVEIPYEQQKRRAGKTHNNFYTLYDAAMLSFTQYTKTPIRIITWTGAVFAFFGLLWLIINFIRFLCGVDVAFDMVMSSIAFFGGLNSVFIGIVGEYVLNVKSKVNKRPLVIEEKRINFDK